MKLTKSIRKVFPFSPQVLGFITRVLGVLLIVDLAAIPAEAKPLTIEEGRRQESEGRGLQALEVPSKDSPSRRELSERDSTTNNNLTAQDKLSSLSSEEAFSAEQAISITPGQSVTEDNPKDADENEEQLEFNFSRKAADLLEQNPTTPSFLVIDDRDWQQEPEANLTLTAQTTSTAQREPHEHEDRPLHRDSSQPGQSLAEQATDPSAILGQLQIQNIFTPSTYDADGYANTFIIQPVLPFKGGGGLPPSISRLTWSAIVTTPDRKTGIPGVEIPGTTNVGDLTWIHIWINEVGKNLRLGAGPSAVFPSAGDDRTGSGKWQLGPNFLVIYSGVPHLTLGFLAQATFSFAGDSDREDIAPFQIEPIIVYHLPKGWYLRWGDNFLTTDLRTGDYNIPLSIGAGKVFQIGSQSVNMFVQPFYTPEGFQSGGKSEWGIKLNVTFILPKLVF